MVKQRDPIANVESALADLHSALVGDVAELDQQQGPIADLEAALADLHSALVGDIVDPDADERFATKQQPSSGANETFVAVEAETSEVQPWLDVANDQAARQREAERFDQSRRRCD